MKRILIDGTPISPKTDGLSQYILNIAARLDMSQDTTWTMLIRPALSHTAEIAHLRDKGLHIIEADIAPIGIKRDLQYIKWFRQHAKEYDAVLCPSNQYPAGIHVPAVYIIHDLIYEEWPQQLGKLRHIKRLWLRHVVRRGLCKASKVICVSSYTRSEVLRLHGNRFAEKIQVIGEGAEHLDKYHNDRNIQKEKYIVYIGSSRGHKNIHRLLQAIKLIHPALKTSGWRLLIIGDTSFYGKQEQTLINELEDIVQSTGWVQDINHLLARAGALIFPSLSEGFGIPLLEAFYYNVPVLCSNRTSLPEVAGNAAIYFNPLDIQDIANKIIYFINTPAIANELTAAGQKRLQLYSWQKAADTISTIMQEVSQ